jgi:hypothetical protein
VAVLYRTVHRNPPNREDFRSGREMGIPKPSRRKELFWLGFSAYDSFDRANATAVAYPHQGNFIAELVIPDTAIMTFDGETFALPAPGGITIARTFSPGHWTVWGEPELFTPLVRRVMPVRREGWG